MKKIKLLLATAALMLGGSVWAQTDVTSTYLTNADFEGTYTEKVQIKNDGRYIYEPNGWTVDYKNVSQWNMTVVASTDAMATNFTGTYAVPADNHKYMVRFRDNQTSEYIDLSQTITVTETGVYTFSADLIRENGSKINVELYAGSNNVSNSTANTWETCSLTVKLTAGTEIKVGIKFTNKGADGVKAGADNVKITYTNPLQAAQDALQDEINAVTTEYATELAAAIATAQDVLDNATTEEELTNAKTTLHDVYLRYKNSLTAATYANPVVTNFVVNGTFDDSDISMWSCNNNFQNKGRKTTDDNNAGNMNSSKPWWENWNGSALVNKMYQTINDIPNGTYRLDITAFVNNFDGESQYVFANDDQTALTDAATTGATYEVYTVVTNNTIEVGLEQTTATASWMGIDNVSLRYYGAGDVINDAQNASHKLAWEEAKTAAEAAIANSDYSNVTGSEKTALQTEIDKAEPSTAAGYDEAAEALTTATQTFVNAKTNYDIFATYNVDLSYADATKKPAITSESTAATILPALRAYYESHAMAEGVTGAVDMTNRIANPNAEDGNNSWTWTGNKNNPANNEPWTDADGNNTHYYFDGGNWNGSNWTTTMKQTISLPAGKFLLTAKGRAATNTTLTMKVGENSVTLPNVGNTGNVFDRGWGDASVEFTTDGNDVEIEVDATANPTHEWFSISQFRLVRLELYTEMATSVEYEAMAAALAAAKAKTLGFEAGEFAPYENVEAIQAIAAAEAVDTNEENAKADIEAITTALGAWTANTVEVDAIFDGQFATTAANTTSGDINLPGWTMVQGIRMLVKDEATDPGLAYTDGKAAVFSWGGTTLTYGEQTGYTLPLNKGEIYEMTMKVSGWRDGDKPNWISVELDGVTMTYEKEVPGRVNDAEGNPFVTLKFYLTPTADNSTLKIYCNKHFTVADLSLKLAVAEDITISENADYTPTETYANVTLARTIKANAWNTFVVPFDITNEELEAAFGSSVAVAEFSENSSDANAVEVAFYTMGTPAITANTPVLLKGNAGSSFTFTGKLIKTDEAKVQGTNVDFVGTYAASTTVKAGDYFISGDKLWKSNGETTIKGTRAYIDAKNSSEVKFFIDGEDHETSISDINGVSENGVIYNLAGQRISKMQKGINIVNGNKILK